MQISRQTDRGTDRHTDRQIYRQIGKQPCTDKRTDKPIQRELETDIPILIYISLDVKTARQSDLHFMHSYWQMELWTDRHIYINRYRQTCKQADRQNYIQTCRETHGQSRQTAIQAGRQRHVFNYILRANDGYEITI